MGSIPKIRSAESERSERVAPRQHLPCPAIVNSNSELNRPLHTRTRQLLRGSAY